MDGLCSEQIFAWHFFVNEILQIPGPMMQILIQPNPHLQPQEQAGEAQKSERASPIKVS